MFGAIANLFIASRQQRAENERFQISRDDASRAAIDDRAALIEQREYDQAVYAQQRRNSLDDTALQFVRMREAAEAGGFNPLAVLQANAGAGMPPQVSMGSGVPVQSRAASIGYVPPTDYMGAAMADAGLLLADSFARTRQASTIGKLNAYQQQNNRLQKQVAKLTLRPAVPGVYAQRRATGGDNGQTSSFVRPSVVGGNAGWSAGQRGAALGSSDQADLRRDVKHQEVVTDLGLMKFDNPNMDPFYVPASGGQPLDNDQYFSIGLGYLGTRALEWYSKRNPWAPFAKPGVPADEALRLRVGLSGSAQRFRPVQRYTRVRETWGPNPKKTAQRMAVTPRY